MSPSRKSLACPEHPARAPAEITDAAIARSVSACIAEGDPLFPAMTSDCLYFAEEYISYAEIAALAMIVWQLANVGIKAVTADDRRKLTPRAGSSPVHSIKLAGAFRMAMARAPQ